MSCRCLYVQSKFWLWSVCSSLLSTWTQRELEILVSKQNSAMKFVSLSLSPPLSLHPPFLPHQEPLPAALSSSGVAGWGYPGSYTAPESPWTVAPWSSSWAIVSKGEFPKRCSTGMARAHFQNGIRLNLRGKGAGLTYELASGNFRNTILSCWVMTSVFLRRLWQSRVRERCMRYCGM